MNTILGLSVTQSRVGWVLIDAAEGPSLDDDAFDVGDRDTVAERAAVAVRGAQAIAAASGHEIRSIGVTWCGEVEAHVQDLLALLKQAGCDDVRAVPPEPADEADCDALDPVEQAYRAADAVATDAVPKPGEQPELVPRSRRATALKLVAASAGVIAALGAGTQFIARDAQPSPAQAAQPVGEPKIVSAHTPLTPTHPATAVRPTAEASGESTYTYSSRQEPAEASPPEVSAAAAQPAAPAARASSASVPESAASAEAHLPAAVPGPVAPGPAMPVAAGTPAQPVQVQATPVPWAPIQPVPAQPAPAQQAGVQPATAQPAAAVQPAAVQPAAPQPAAAQPAQPQQNAPADPLAALMSALP